MAQNRAKVSADVKLLLATYPEVNVLIPLWHHAKESKVPAAKAVPVRIRRELRGAA